jgi:protocatechuate 3,4-dioxygenase beta subunit
MWHARALGVLGSLVLACMSLADPAPLSGVVTSQDGGPIEGARVVVWTGNAINDVPLLCPSCYADCGRAQTTDDAGEFTFEGVDDQVAFRLVIVADGHHPLHTQYVTPGQEPRTFTLNPRKPVEQASRLIRGRVVDAQGRPVADAMVRPEMWWFDSARRGGSHLEGSDPFAFTGDDGHFELAAGSAVHGASLYVEGPVLAPTRESLVRSGLPLEDQPDITLHTGVAVNGRLVGADGQPLPGVMLNLQSVDRRHDRYYGPVTYGTDDRGRFSFQNVPANTQIEIIGGMVQLKGHGVPEAKRLTTGDNDTTIDAGDIHLEPGHTIRGRVVLSDGKPLPKGGRKIEFGSRGDLQRADIADDGTFLLENVPADEFGMSVQMPGYHISRWNPNRDHNNRDLIGTVRGDADDFVVLLEPGHEPRQAWGHTFRNGEHTPVLDGIKEPLPEVLGGRLRPVSIHAQAENAEGWKTYPWHATIMLPADTTADNPRTIVVTATDPIRPYLPAERWTIDATHEVVGLEWPAALFDAQVLRLEITDGENAQAELVDTGFPGMSRFVLHRVQDAGEANVSLGRVLDASGQPIARARVTPMAYWRQNAGRAPWPGGTRLTRTDQAGHFAVSATDAYDRVQVRVSAPGHADQVFDVVPELPRQDLTMPAPATLTLTAHDPQGQPAPFAVATLWRRNQQQSWSVLDFATADDDGRIAFEHAPTGEPLQVVIKDTAHDQGTAWSAVAIESIEGETHDAGVISAEQTAVIEGQLVAMGEMHLEQRPALVLHRMSSGDRVTVRPGDDGAFAFPPVPAREAYAITYHGPGFLHPAHPATIQGFAPDCTAVGGTLEGDLHLRLMIQSTWDGGPTPQFVGQDAQRPLTSISGTRRTR